MNKSYILAFLMAAAVVGWIWSGQLQPSKADGEAVQGETVAEEAKKKDAPVTVRVRLMQARPHQRAVILRGRTQAVRSVAVKAEIAGRITELAVRKGDLVKKGDLIGRIDMLDRAARLAEARALVTQRKLEHKAATICARRT